jgi:membrane fusion protein
MDVDTAEPSAHYEAAALAPSDPASTDELFRAEVLRRVPAHTLGTINVATPVAYRIWTVVFVSIVTLIVTALMLGSYTRHQVVSGTLVPTSGTIDLTTSRSGRVTKILVPEGGTVAQGQPLLELRDESSTAESARPREQIIASLHVQLDTFEQARVGARQARDAQIASIERQRTQLRMQIQQAQQTLSIEARQLSTTQALLGQITPLRDKGYVSALQIQTQEVQVNAAAKDVSSTQQQIHELQASLSQLDGQSSTANEDYRQKVTSAEESEAQVRQQLEQAQITESSMIRAPVAGRVAALAVRSGQYAPANQALGSILPQGSRLRAEILVDSKAIPFVKPGTRVVLRYDALPYQKFGVFEGVVESVTEATLQPTAGATAPGYRVDVALKSQTVQLDGRPFALRPGMPFSADLLLERRTIMEWLFEPLLAFGRNLTATQGPEGPQ